MTTIPEFTPEAIAAGLRDATPVGPEAARRAQTGTAALVDAAFAHTRTEAPWERLSRDADCASQLEAPRGLQYQEDSLSGCELNREFA